MTVTVPLKQGEVMVNVPLMVTENVPSVCSLISTVTGSVSEVEILKEVDERLSTLSIEPLWVIDILTTSQEALYEKLTVSTKFW